MEIAVHRSSSVPVPEQIRFQLELHILSGALRPGERLPSVRALARRLGLHANTVGAAYRSLEATGRVRSRSGSGVFVEATTPQPTSAGRDADAALGEAFDALLRRGLHRPELRAAVERWLDRPPPTRVVVVDRTVEMAELLAFEIRAALKVPTSAHALADLPPAAALADSVLVTLPYHAGPLSRLRPGQAVEAVRLAVSEPCRHAVAALAADSLVLTVSHAAAVFPYAQAVVHGMRGEELTLLTHLGAERGRWEPAARNAALVLADALSLAAVGEVCPRGVQELRLLDLASLAPLAARL